MNEQQLAAVKLALYVIQAWENGCHRDDYWSERDDAITALQSIIEQPAPVQEPDGYVYGNSYWEATNLRITDDVKRFGSPRYATPPIVATPLVTQQKPWVGLTDKDIAEAGHLKVEGPMMLPYSFARAIEAKLKAKNERKEKNT